MDFLQILESARVNQLKIDEKRACMSKEKSKLGTKQVNPEAVKALLKRKEDAQKKQNEEERKKKAELMKLRAEQNRLGKVSRLVNLSKKKLTLTEIEGSEQVNKKSHDDKKLNKNSHPERNSSVKDQVQSGSKVTSKPSRTPSRSQSSKPSTSQSSRHSTPSHSSKHPVKTEPAKNENSNNAKLVKPPASQNTKPKKTAPPPMSYKDVLRLAVKQQNAPPTPIPVPKEKPKSTKYERPLTQEEKDRLARKQTKEYQDWIKYGKPLQPQKEKEATKSNASVDTKRTTSKVPAATNSKHPNGQLSKTDNAKSKKAESAKSQPANSAPRNLVQRPSQKQCVSSSCDSKVVKSRTENTSQLSNWDKVYSPQKKPSAGLKRKLPPKFEEEDDDDMSDFIDEDSEMDDFIDDSNNIDVSSEIQKIFGYNKSKYIDEDDDDRAMEASWADVMKEERMSARIGLKEDLEDIRREKEEERLKALKTAKRKKTKVYK